MSWQHMIHWDRLWNSHNGGMVGEEVAEMTELTYLITERSTTIFISQWKPLMEFLLKNKNERLIYMFKG